MNSEVRAPTAAAPATPSSRGTPGPGSQPEPAGGDGPIVFFDGVCALCNRFVDFVVRRDPGHRLRWAPLQGSTAADRLPAGLVAPTPSSIVLLEAGRVRERSDAVLAILAGLGGIWSLFAVFRIVPRGLRDLVYGWVAANRYRWFGRREVCRLPTPEERSVILP